MRPFPYPSCWPGVIERGRKQSDQLAVACRVAPPGRSHLPECGCISSAYEQFEVKIRRADIGTNRKSLRLSPEAVETEAGSRKRGLHRVGDGYAPHVFRGALGGTRTPTMLLTATSRQRVYQFRHERLGNRCGKVLRTGSTARDVTNRRWRDKGCHSWRKSTLARNPPNGSQAAEAAFASLRRLCDCGRPGPPRLRWASCWQVS